MSHFIDITGNKYNRLTVLERVEGTTPATWRCICDCGNITFVRGQNLKSGAVKSCGCLLHEKHNTHHLSQTKIYHIWHAMINRCYYKKGKAYKNYGGRGIKVCEDWKKSFDSFYAWSIDNGYQEGLSIERINNNDDYKPTNCKWIKRSEQAQNRRRNYSVTINGVTKNLTEWCIEYGVDYGLVHNRCHKLHWDFEKALTTPCDITKRNKK